MSRINLQQDKDHVHIISDSFSCRHENLSDIM